MTGPRDDAEVSVVEVPERNRFEIRIGDEVAGFTVYRPQEGRYTFFHTEIDPAFEGRGLGSVLIKDTLNDMQSRGIAVLPQCPFVRRYISRHTEYLDLVPADERDRFELPAA